MEGGQLLISSEKYGFTDMASSKIFSGWLFLYAQGRKRKLVADAACAPRGE